MAYISNHNIEEKFGVRVIPASHQKKILESNAIKTEIKNVQKGGILIMKPLVLHSSKRNENQMNRRIVHIEFSSMDLPKGLEWLEKYEII